MLALVALEYLISKGELHGVGKQRRSWNRAARLGGLRQVMGDYKVGLFRLNTLEQWKRQKSLRFVQKLLNMGKTMLLRELADYAKRHENEPRLAGAQRLRYMVHNTHLI